MFGCGRARIEVDCNLKNLANFFKFFLCILKKSLKIDYGLFFRRKKLVRAISSYKTGSLSNIWVVLTKLQHNWRERGPLTSTSCNKSFIPLTSHIHYNFTISRVSSRIIRLESKMSGHAGRDTVYERRVVAYNTHIVSEHRFCHVHPNRSWPVVNFENPSRAEDDFGLFSV